METVATPRMENRELISRDPRLLGVLIWGETFRMENFEILGMHACEL